MIQYTTPLQRVLIPGKDLTSWDVYVTYSNRWRKATVTVNPLDMEVTEEGTILTYRLTQEQTALFDKDEEVEIQVNWYKDGIRGATKRKNIYSEENLLKVVIS